MGRRHRAAQHKCRATRGWIPWLPHGACKHAGKLTALPWSSSPPLTADAVPPFPARGALTFSLGKSPSLRALASVGVPVCASGDLRAPENRARRVRAKALAALVPAKLCPAHLTDCGIAAERRRCLVASKRGRRICHALSCELKPGTEVALGRRRGHWCGRRWRGRWRGGCRRGHRHGGRRRGRRRGLRRGRGHAAPLAPPGPAFCAAVVPLRTQPFLRCVAVV
mmetsp:Transcript_82399/g.228620  ORF Transcript_82399/g.228620 Transcript_82399/m.228620 type:complete len:224 (+) Transcript_82399:108-779(+)